MIFRIRNYQRFIADCFTAAIFDFHSRHPLASPELPIPSPTDTALISEQGRAGVSEAEASVGIGWTDDERAKR